MITPFPFVINCAALHTVSSNPGLLTYLPQIYPPATDMQNPSFCWTIKPFMSDKSPYFGDEIILREGDKIINNTRVKCEIFNTYFTSMANNIGFDESIPPNFYACHGFSAMIDKYCKHPSIVKIRENISNDLVFNFQCVNATISKIIKSSDGLSAHGYNMVPMEWLQKLAPYIAPDTSRLMDNSVLESMFPSGLKFAEASSLFKKKDNLNKNWL